MLNLKSIVCNLALVSVFFVINVVVGISFAFAGNCDTKNTEFDRGEVFRDLKLGGFSGVLNQKVELNKIGDIKVSGACLNLFAYVYTSGLGGEPTGAQHMSKRLLILSKSRYLGMYSLDEFPVKLFGNTLEFIGDKDEGNSIVFDSESPPERIFLDGEVRELFK